MTPPKNAQQQLYTQRGLIQRLEERVGNSHKEYEGAIGQLQKSENDMATLEDELNKALLDLKCKKQLEDEIKVLQERVAGFESKCQDTQGKLQYYGKRNDTLLVELNKARAELQSKDGVLKVTEDRHKREIEVFLAHMNRLQGKLDKAERMRQRTMMESIRSAADAGHDYNSPFPSPAELVKSVQRFSDGQFADFMDIAMEHAAEWKMKGDDEDFVQATAKQVLVETVRQCHMLVQQQISSRLESLGYFLRGTPLLGSEDIGSGCLTEPPCIEALPSTTFRQAHRYVFAEFFPGGSNYSAMVDKVFENVLLRSGRRVPLRAASLRSVEQVSKVYSGMVMSLLQTFLECELTRPKPLRFLESFGREEMWSENIHCRATIDPWYEGSGVLSSSDKVKVVLPPLYLAKDVDACDGKLIKPEAKAVVFVLSNSTK